MKELRILKHRVRRVIARRATLYVYLKSGSVLKLPVSKDGGWKNLRLGSTDASYKFTGLLVTGVQIQPTQIEAVVLK